MGPEFPPPETVLVPAHNDKFELVLADLVDKEIAKDPSVVRQQFDKGRTLLHLSALYGRLPSVRLLLDKGADKRAKCNRGWTASDYASSMDWTAVKELLEH